MKRYTFIGILFFIAGCSSTSNDGTSSTAAATTTCASGYLYSAYGCQPQCGTNAVWYNNQCLSATTTTSSTTCQAGYLYSAYGCQPQCGTNMVWYGNQCIAIPMTTTTGTTCQGQCPTGYTQTRGSCLPQGTCGACYGLYQGYCYMGDYAHAYYGY